MTSSANSVQNALWTATAREAAPATRPFEPAAHVEIAVVGGGFTGLSAALAAAEAGARVAVLEARHVGWGASGRNGGQVIPGLKLDPSQMREAYGDVAGRRLTEAVGNAADVVFRLIAMHAIDCQPQRSGWIQAAHAGAALARVQQRGGEWAALGAPVDMLDRAQLKALTGTDAYLGGWRDRRAFTIQPLDYLRGLARAAVGAGARIHEQTRVTSLTRQGASWRIVTPHGAMTATTVIVGGDGYTDGLITGLAESLLVVQSAQVATEPLPADLAATIMPAGLCASETRRLAFYFRQSSDGRLLFGGRGAVGDAENPAFFDALIAAMHRTFPQSRALRIAHRWSGQVALTIDGLPHLHEPEPNLLVAVGYNGRGVAMATIAGRWLAEKALSGQEPPLPFTPLVPLSWHRLRRPAIALGIAWAWTRDRIGLAG